MQLSQRAEEVKLAAELVCDIADRPCATGKAAEDDEPADAQLARLLLHGRINKRVVAAMGHSFGAATALTAAHQDNRFTSCVLLDTWMFPLSAVLLSRGMGTVPVLSITGEGYRKWRANFVAESILLDAQERAKYARGPASSSSSTASSSSSSSAAAAAAAASINISGSNGVSREGRVLTPDFFVADPDVHPATAMVTVRGMEHASFSDFGLLAGRLMRLKGMLGPRDVGSGLRIVNDLTADFVTRVSSLQTKARSGGTVQKADWLYRPPAALASELLASSQS